MKVIACFAASLDGKIAPPNTDHYVRISSDADIAHLKALRNEADAILMGGATFRAYPKPHRGTTPDQSPEDHLSLSGGRIPLHGILTQNFNLPPQAPLFQTAPPVPTWIFSPNEAPPEIQRQYPNHVRWQRMHPTQPAHSVLQALGAAGAQTVLIEGGGQIFQLFLKEKLVQELYLTLCPLLIGGRDTPSLLGDAAFWKPFQIRAETLSIQPLESDLLLHLKINYVTNR